MKTCYVPVAKMAKLFLQVKYRQPRLVMSHALRLDLSYQRIPSWNTITKLARPSKRQTCLCKNGIGDLTHSFCFHMSGMHYHLGSNLLHSKITKRKHIFI